MGKAWIILLSVFALANVSGINGVHSVCRGFLPPNNLRRPMTVMQQGGLTQDQFNHVIDQVNDYFTPIIAARGATLQINRLWDNSTVNASAQETGSTYILNMYGGLARDPNINIEGFTLVVCHEMGHHLGGAPKESGWFGSSWASNEGEADYYAALRCMRYIFNDADNQQYVNDHQKDIDPFLKQKCEETWNNQADENLCIREGMAGVSVSYLFQELSQDTERPRFDTPDTSVVSQTEDSHPATQCRMDTYFQGSLCVQDAHDGDLSDTDANVGACTIHNGFKVGLRPACWFHEDDVQPSSVLD